jgi:hypothetical protein
MIVNFLLMLYAGAIAASAALKHQNFFAGLISALFIVAGVVFFVSSDSKN